MERYDILIVGGGAAGMAAAISAAQKGRRVLLCERDRQLGGVLRQCLHRGFGRAFFEEDLTGPEYAARFLPQVEAAGVTVRTGTEVLSLREDRTALLSSRDGLDKISFERCILAAGCTERTLGSLNIAGTRPAGVFTAGTAQRLVNLGGKCIGHRIVFLGTGDIGQIMARQFIQDGYEVVVMLEQADHPGGLARNRRECLEAYQIPVRLRATVDEVLGEGRIRGVIARDLDSGKRWEIPCDTLITAIGLLPDRTLCRNIAPDGTLPDWLRLAGNCDSVHDIVDSVSREAALLGASEW